MINPNPCKKDCPNRNQYCHSLCEAYLKFRAELDEENAKRKRDYTDSYMIARTMKRRKIRNEKRHT